MSSHEHTIVKHLKHEGKNVAKSMAIGKAKRVRGHKDKEHAYAALLKANRK